ncbi:MAG: PilZ domain-containing protein [Thermoanaerobaculia bacterium]
MSEDQRRNAERVPLDIPIEGKIGEISVSLVEISLIGCLLEHSDRMAMGSTFTVGFRWAGENVSLKGRVARTQMRVVDGRPGYQSGIQFAESVETSPEPLQRVLRSLLPDSMPELEQAAPSLFAEHPFFRHADDDDDDEPVIKVAAAGPPRAEKAPSVPQFDEGLDERLDEEPAAARTESHPSENHLESPAHDDLEPELELEMEDVNDELELDFGSDLQFPDHVAPPTPYIQCTLTNGVWDRQEVSEPSQPREGFTIVRPENDQEITELCHSYLVADPDTRKLIRVSFDLVNAQQRSLSRA